MQLKNIILSFGVMLIFVFSTATAASDIIKPDLFEPVSNVPDHNTLVFDEKIICSHLIGCPYFVDPSFEGVKVLLSLHSENMYLLRAGSKANVRPGKTWYIYEIINFNTINRETLLHDILHILTKNSGTIPRQLLPFPGKNF